MPLDQDCRRCALWQGRRRVVPPSGDPRSKVVLVGEAPGEREDLLGRPFVGRAGRTLDRLMQDVGLERDEVLITNTVKCRPPGNRRPTEGEVRACRPYLEEELEGKAFVLALGLSAAEGLLGRKVRLKEEANQEFEVPMGEGTIKVMVTYHPSACIYRPQAKEVLREALRAARAYL